MLEGHGEMGREWENFKRGTSNVTFWPLSGQKPIATEALGSSDFETNILEISETGFKDGERQTKDIPIIIHKSSFPPPFFNFSFFLSKVSKRPARTSLGREPGTHYTQAQPDRARLALPCRTRSTQNEAVP